MTGLTQDSVQSNAPLQAAGWTQQRASFSCPQVLASAYNTILILNNRLLLIYSILCSNFQYDLCLATCSEWMSQPTPGEF